MARTFEQFPHQRVHRNYQVLLPKSRFYLRLFSVLRTMKSLPPVRKYQPKKIDCPELPKLSGKTFPLSSTLRQWTFLTLIFRHRSLKSWDQSLKQNGQNLKVNNTCKKQVGVFSYFSVAYVITITCKAFVVFKTCYKHLSILISLLRNLKYEQLNDGTTTSQQQHTSVSQITITYSENYILSALIINIQKIVCLMFKYKIICCIENICFDTTYWTWFT